MARVFMELVGDATSAIKALIGTKAETQLLAESTVSSNTEIMGSNDKLALNIEKTTKIWADATTKRVDLMRLQAAEARKLAAVVGESSTQGALLMQRAASREASASRLTGVPLVVGAGESEVAADERRKIDEKNASQFLRGAAKGAGGLGGLGFAALAGSSFIGAYVGASALKSLVSAAAEANATEKLLAQSTRSAGASYAAWKPEIDKTTQALSDQTGFTNDQINQGLIPLVRATGNVSEALKLSGLAADIARGRNIDYNTSALLLSKVVNGNVGLLKRYGVEVQTGATPLEALAAAQRKYAGAAEAYGKSSQGSFERTSAAIHNAEVTIGRALLPVLARASTAFANWLDKLEKSGKLERDVKSATHDIGTAFHDLRGPLSLVADDFGTLIKRAQQLKGLWAGLHPPSWLGLGNTQTGGGSGGLMNFLGDAAKVVFVPGYGLYDVLHGHPPGGGGSGSGGGGGSSAAERARAQAEDAYYRRHPYPGHGTGGGTLDKFTLASLPQHLQNEIARAVTPAQKRRADEDEAAAITKLLDTKGALSPAARTEALKDRARAEAQIAQIDKSQAAATKAAARAAATAVGRDPLLAKAKLDLAQGETAAADRLLRTDKARLEEELSQAKTSEMRLALMKQLTQVEKELQAKDAGFVESKKLQVAQARADALAALTGNPTKLQLRLAEQLKEQAMKAINSHRLTMEGLIQAWQAVQQANSVIAGFQGQTNTYHAVSAKSMVDAVAGLTRAQKIQLEEEYSQAQAHRGYAPRGPAAEGQEVHVHIHSDIDQTITKIDKKKRQRHQRAGGRR